MMKEFKHFISLGFFCSVASELEKYGYRTASGPFDWQACDSFREKIELIETRFEKFWTNFSLEGLYQGGVNLHTYEMKACKFTFVHDFDKYRSLQEQLPAVREKYRRRIDRFYENIQEKSLFIRYVNPEEDIKWIEDNEDRILYLLKSFNAENEIIYVSNSDVPIGVKNVFYVNKDFNDFVARRFISNSESLRLYLESLPFSQSIRSNNIRRFKTKRIRRVLTLLSSVARRLFVYPFKEPYIHYKKR